MLKAVFLDYNGTTVSNDGPEMQEVISRVIHGSSLNSVEEFMQVWWKQIRSAEALSNSGTFVSEEDITRGCLQFFADHYGLHENLDELQMLIQGFWTNAPLYPDVVPFFRHCPWPVYIISNNGARYIIKRMESAGLKPSGLICGEMVQAYKPRPDLFLQALRESGCRPDEVLHIGDSLSSDYQTAEVVGIPAVLLDRDGRYENTAYRKADSLIEILDRLLSEETFVVEEIIEPDYGCEGIPEGELPRCRLMLRDHAGNHIAATELDAKLYERKIDEGSRVILSDACGILPADI